MADVPLFRLFPFLPIFASHHRGNGSLSLSLYVIDIKKGICSRNQVKTDLNKKLSPLLFSAQPDNSHNKNER